MKQPGQTTKIALSVAGIPDVSKFAREFRDRHKGGPCLTAIRIQAILPMYIPSNTSARALPVLYLLLAT